MANSTVKFQAHVWIGPEHHEFDVWVYELYPHQDSTRRTAASWVYEYLTTCLTHEDVLKLFGLPKEDEKKYQVLFSGTLSGYGPDHNGEYDEGLDLNEYHKAEWDSYLPWEDDPTQPDCLSSAARYKQDWDALQARNATLNEYEALFNHSGACKPPIWDKLGLQTHSRYVLEFPDGSFLIQPPDGGCWVGSCRAVNANAAVETRKPFDINLDFHLVESTEDLMQGMEEARAAKALMFAMRGGDCAETVYWVGAPGVAPYRTGFIWDRNEV